MKFKKLSILLLSTAVLAGCANGNAAPTETTTVETTTETETETTQESADPAETTADPDETDDLYSELTLNEYDGLEITAEILTRNAIIPGSTIPVTVIIANNGEKSISFTQGSGSFTTPQALSLAIDGLQPVLPSDHLGAATMDFVTKELKPGEELSFVMNIKAIEPNDEFNTYTYELYNQKQIYIGDMDIEDLFNNYEDLVPAKAGTYEGLVTFLYQTIEDENAADRFGEPTGYNQVPVSITVTE